MLAYIKIRTIKIKTPTTRRMLIRLASWLFLVFVKYSIKYQKQPITVNKPVANVA